MVARSVPVVLGVALIVSTVLTFFAGDFGALSELLWLPFVVRDVLVARRLIAFGGADRAPVRAASPAEDVMAA